MDSQHYQPDQAFIGFIAFLSPDPDEGGRLYEELRARLIRYFRLRGLNNGDEGADEALDRVMRRLHEGEAIEDYIRYSYGVARLVAIEMLRNQKSVSLDMSTFVDVTQGDEADGEDPRLDALRGCLQNLDDSSRGLLLEYFSIGSRRLHERDRLARRYGLNINSLRLRVFRMKGRLKDCLEKKFQ